MIPTVPPTSSRPALPRTDDDPRQLERGDAGRALARAGRASGEQAPASPGRPTHGLLERRRYASADRMGLSGRTRSQRARPRCLHAGQSVERGRSLLDPQVARELRFVAAHFLDEALRAWRLVCNSLDRWYGCRYVRRGDWRVGSHTGKTGGPRFFRGPTERLPRLPPNPTRSLTTVSGGVIRGRELPGVPPPRA